MGNCALPGGRVGATSTCSPDHFLEAHGLPSRVPTREMKEVDMALKVCLAGATGWAGSELARGIAAVG